MSDCSIPPPSDQDWLACQEIAKSHGRSFFLASRMLSPRRRRAILAAYAYCRVADDIVDRFAGSPAEVESRLVDWENQIEAPTHPVAIAFSASRIAYGVPERPVRELFDGMRADLTVNRYATWADLRAYCHQVAGTVGLIVAPIMGCADSSALVRAAELGIAMQLTNILRDVGEDAAMGRIYLPLDELAHFGIDPNQLILGNPGRTFPHFMRFQIERARALYDHALTATPALSRSGRLTTLVAARLYSGILGQIEANEFDVFSMRAVVPTSSKALGVVSATSQFLRMSSPSSPVFSSDSVFGTGHALLGQEPDAEGRI